MPRTYDGPLPADDMNFVQGAPTFAVEVRSKADDFQAGTLVVWDIDPRVRRILSYRATTPGQPVTFHEGQTADAEPAVPGWRMVVHDVFA